LPFEYPPLAVGALTFGAVPVAAGVIGVALMTTGITSVQMTTQRRRSAFSNGVEYTQVLLEGMIVINECITIEANNIGQFMSGPDGSVHSLPYKVSRGL
jgi:hypothetical protein